MGTAGTRESADPPRPPVHSLVLLVTAGTGIVSLVVPLYARSLGVRTRWAAPNESVAREFSVPQ